MSTFDKNPKIRSETEKPWNWNATVFRKTDFCHSDLVFGVI